MSTAKHTDLDAMRRAGPGQIHKTYRSNSANKKTTINWMDRVEVERSRFGKTY